MLLDKPIIFQLSVKIIVRCGTKYKAKVIVHNTITYNNHYHSQTSIFLKSFISNSIIKIIIITIIYEFFNLIGVTNYFKINSIVNIFKYYF